MSIETLSILWPACIAGILVMLTHVPLGMEVLKRGIIFIDLAIAQIAALGVLLVRTSFEDSNMYLEQFMALAFALAAAMVFRWTEQKASPYQEAIIGASFIVCSSLSILLVTGHAHGGDEIKSMLAGQLLWVDSTQIIIAAIVYGLLGGLWLVQKKISYFYVVFALSITISVQLVGIYLVFASLILPALSVVCTKENKLIMGYIVALISLILGLLGSLYLDLPSAPVVVCVLALVSFVYVLIMKAKNSCTQPE
ncbi:MAG: metal ABC transporter permease [Rickettsiales bacterium]|nr:metal ABC transporter permease [Rickettsiales bacterium]